MARRRKVPKKLGPQRIVRTHGNLEIKQTEFCPECELRLKVIATQKPYLVIGMVCYNIDNHKTGKIYCWLMEDVEILTS